MDWKEFFKPTKCKVIFSVIIIFLIGILAFWVGYGAILACEPCDSTLAYCSPCRSLGSGFDILIITLLPSIIIIYFMVSLFSYLFRKTA